MYIVSKKERVHLMKLVILSGSGRKESNSLKLGQFILGKFQSKALEIELIDLCQYGSLLHHYEPLTNQQLLTEKEQLLHSLYQCDGLIIIAPEWGGMLPPILHNTLLLTAYGSAGGFPLAHKPAFAIGVSASGGGHNPISLLKGYGAKNPHLVWLPFHLIINNIEEFLSALNVAGSNLTSREFQLVSRLEIGIEALTLYAKQLSPIRNELVTLSEKHPFGQ